MLFQLFKLGAWLCCVYICNRFLGDHGRARFYRRHKVTTWPILPTLPSTLDNGISYALAVPAGAMLREQWCGTRRHEYCGGHWVHLVRHNANPVLMPLYKELTAIFSCEVTLFAHGLNLIAITSLHYCLHRNHPRSPQCDRCHRNTTDHECWHTLAHTHLPLATWIKIANMKTILWHVLSHVLWSVGCSNRIRVSPVLHSIFTECCRIEN